MGVKEEYTTIQNICWDAYANGLKDNSSILEYVKSRYTGEFAVELSLIDNIMTGIRAQVFNV